ncbi:type II toxin-antitoxin system VapC family toxin, partial [Candidatus Roizmanbacteria bacterium]|nr:type II toxin-antitoxin system VapC family toxin [Candidatus Roizmanbacteria bacterium]
SVPNGTGMGRAFKINYLISRQFTIIERKGKTIARVGFAISVITLAEYLVGAYKSTSPEKNIHNFENFLNSNDIPVIEIDSNIAYCYAQNLSHLEQRGQKNSGFDMLIAATAISKKLILISDDKAFTRIKELEIITGV